MVDFILVGVVIAIFIAWKQKDRVVVIDHRSKEIEIGSMNHHHDHNNHQDKYVF